MKNEPIRPTPEQLNALTKFERFSFNLADFFNSNPIAKTGAGLFLRSVGASWVYYLTRNLIHIIGLDHLRNLKPPRGLLLASNHRTFFDQYVIACWLFRSTNLLKRIYFPVRAEFWYQRPAGVLVSLIGSGLSMYPPVFREQGKRDFNHYGVKRLVQLLQEPGSVVGVHPEGTRNKGEDPYTLLKAQPGIGKVIMDAHPTVLPIFLNGLSDDVWPQVTSNFYGTGRPIIIVIGKPLDLSSYYSQRNALRTQKDIADYVLAQIGELGAVEREYREKLRQNPVRGPVLI